MQDNLNNKISANALDIALEAFKSKILKEMSAQIDGDQMKRLATLE
jgi:hypothetical protein